MEMGPIMQIIVEGNVAALVYHMYLTPKAAIAPTFDMLVTEYNTVEERDGKLMVTHLDLYTDGGGLNNWRFTSDGTEAVPNKLSGRIGAEMFRDSYL